MKGKGLQGAALKESDSGQSKAALTDDPNMLNDEEELDVEIGVAILTKLLREPEAQGLFEEALSGAGDPAAKLGVLFSQAIEEVQTRMQDTPIPLSPRIWLSDGGVIDRMLEDVGLPPQITSGVKDEIANILKLRVQSRQGPAGQGQPEGPPMDQQAMMMGGGNMSMDGGA